MPPPHGTGQVLSDCSESQGFKDRPELGMSYALTGGGWHLPDLWSCQGLPETMQETQFNLNFKTNRLFVV